MSLTYGGVTIISDDYGPYNGEHRFTMGGIDKEEYKKSIPGAPGVIRTFSGMRGRTHKVSVRWNSTDEEMLLASLRALYDPPQYLALEVQKSDGTGIISFTAPMILNTPKFGVRGTGVNAQGYQVAIIACELEFEEDNP